ncbi:MAG: hypothetical protein WD872_09925 [Pirellulaceae bacterium]
MTGVAPRSRAADWPRQLARASIAAAFVSCTLNCVFSQIAARAGAGPGRLGWLVDWSSLLVVLAGIAVGIAALAGGLRRKSLDTATIAAIGLVLNLGIVFVIVWYFAVVRPAAM